MLQKNFSSTAVLYLDVTEVILPFEEISSLMCYIPSVQEINFLTWIFGIWSLTDFLLFGWFFGAFSDILIVVLARKRPYVLLGSTTSFWEAGKTLIVPLWRVDWHLEWAKVKNGFRGKPFRSWEKSRKNFLLHLSIS